MNKYFFLWVFIIFSVSHSFCSAFSTTDLIFSRQGQIDSFTINYPNYTNIEGNVLIEGIELTEIKNLNGLYPITSIEGDLIIKNNVSLFVLSGLENLNTIGGKLEINYCYNLGSVEGLNGLMSVGTDLYLKDNWDLANLAGLENLSYIGRNISLSRNYRLHYIEGLNSISVINGDFYLYLSHLKSFKGLDNLTEISGNFIIKSCVESFEDLTNLTEIGGRFHLEDCRVNDFTGLENLNSITDRIEIISPRNLQNFEGLESLIIVNDDFVVKNASKLQNFEGLNNMEQINGSLILKNNVILENFEGFDNLTTIYRNLELLSNPMILNFDGLNSLEYIGLNLNVSNNAFIENFVGLNSLTSVGNDFIISQNESLIDFSGLDIFSTVHNEFMVLQNNSLNDFTGLTNFDYAGNNFIISNNSNLINFNGIDNINLVEGDLIINNNESLKNLQGLNNLNIVEGSVSISENPNLTGSEDLEDLDEIYGDLLIFHNELLSNLSGFINIKEIGGSLSLYSNDRLITLNEMENLTTLGGYLSISQNSWLEDISGLSNLNSIKGRLEITFNNSLTSLDGLENINPNTIKSSDSNFKDIEIYYNDILSQCSIESICNALKINNKTNDIHDNALGCSSKNEIILKCYPSCLDTGIVFTTQKQIDDFNINYPNCKLIRGDVVINDSTENNITNLLGIAQVLVIDGNLQIDSNKSLKTINGLDSLIFINGDLIIHKNDSLSSLKGFYSLDSIYGNLVVDFNDSLKSLSGLDSLKLISGYLALKNNKNLEDIKGISNIVPESIASKDSLYMDIIISNNPVLSFCSIESICQSIGLGKNMTINNNKKGCNNEMEIDSLCFGTCLPEGLKLLSQKDVDDFIIKYPHCNEILGDLDIGDRFDHYSVSNISTLLGLKNIEKINGDFNVYSNGSLVDFKGLTNLKTVGKSIWIYYNPNLKSFEGMDNLENIGQDLNMRDDMRFESLEKLNKIKEIKRISINSLNSITSLTGLESVIKCQYVILTVNPNLTDISALENLDPYHIKIVTIKDNNKLSECSIESFCNYSKLNGSLIYAFRNMEGCNSANEIKEKCDEGLCTSLLYPQNGSTKIPSNITLKWQTVEGAAGYNLSVGIGSNFNSIIDNIDVGNVDTFRLNNLPCGSRINVLLTPYNESGDMSFCPKEYFNTNNFDVFIENDNFICYGSSIEFEAYGGINYHWYPIDDLSNPNIRNPIASPKSTTKYTVISDDGEGCIDSASILLYVNPEIEIEKSFSDETTSDANDGSASVVVSGGTEPYSYLWSTGDTTSTISGLSPGRYYISITDSENCLVIDSIYIRKYECKNVTVDANSIDISCNGLCDGSISITKINNGIAPYIYKWDSGDTTSYISNLCSGNYNLTVEDSDHCIVKVSYYIKEPEILYVNIESSDETSFQSNDGVVVANTYGGIPPYHYIWSTGDTTSSIMNLTPGIYYVTVSDKNGCVEIDSSVINKFICPDSIVVIKKDDVSCFGECDGNIFVSDVPDGVPPFKYLWSNGDSLNELIDICAGQYILEVIDSNNCVDFDTITITQPEEILITIDSVNNIVDSNGGYISVEINGTEDYLVNWTGPCSFSSDSLNLSHLECPGCYELIVKDTLNDCSADTTICIKKTNVIYDLDFLSKKVKLYPNPAKNEVILEFNDIELEKSDIKLIDVTGKTVNLIVKKQNSSSLLFELSHLKSGIYFIRIRMKGYGILYNKLIIN